MLGKSVAADEDGWDRRCQRRPQLRNHVNTRPALRQTIIAYDQIRASVVLADASERRLIGICRQHVVTPTHQRFARGFEHKHIIVDDGDEPEPRCFGGCFR